MHSRNHDLNVVLVYLGDQLPTYVRRNLSYLRSQFPGATTWLITDSVRIERKFKNTDQKVWLYQDANNTWSDIQSKMNFPQEFRRGFWFLTLKRFKAIEEFMVENPNPVLHVEADVFLMPNFPLDDFKVIEKSMAFPIVGSGYAAASTLFIQNSSSIMDFNKYVEESTQKNPNAIDMTILHDYAITHSDKVQILASGPSFRGKTKGYFDGAAFGTFLVGQDPRNFRGMTIKYSPIDWHSDKVSELRFAMEGNSLVTVLHGVSTPVYSLHIHSKKASLFSIKGLGKALRKAIKEYEFGPKRILAPEVLIPLFSAALKRRFQKVIYGG